VNERMRERTGIEMKGKDGIEITDRDLRNLRPVFS
jgi:hypothetical protein